MSKLFIYNEKESSTPLTVTSEGEVINLHPEIPNKQALREKFMKEHILTEDEIRFFVEGKGVFTILNFFAISLSINLYLKIYRSSNLINKL